MATSENRITAKMKDKGMLRERFNLRCLNLDACLRQLRESFAEAGYSLELDDFKVSIWRKTTDNDFPVKVGEIYSKMDGEPVQAVYTASGLVELASEIAES